MNSRPFQHHTSGLLLLSVLLTLLSPPFSLEAGMISGLGAASDNSNLLTNLAAYWNFDEIAGNAASSVNNNLLANVNSTSYAVGKINRGASFAASYSNYFRIANANQTGLDITSDFSLSLWIRLTSQPGGAYPYYHLINKWNEADQRSFSLTYTTIGGTPALYMGLSEGGIDSSATDLYYFNTTLNNAAWHHVVLSWDAGASATSLYLNGSSVATATGSNNWTSMFNSTADLLIGTHLDPESPAGHGYLDGMMDEVGIWSRALSAGEVATLYNSGKGLTYPFTPAPEPSTLALASAGAVAAVAYVGLRRRKPKAIRASP
jgi:hypothetical protein